MTRITTNTLSSLWHWQLEPLNYWLLALTSDFGVESGDSEPAIQFNWCGGAASSMGRILRMLLEDITGYAHYFVAGLIGISKMRHSRSSRVLFEDKQNIGQVFSLIRIRPLATRILSERFTWFCSLDWKRGWKNVSQCCDSIEWIAYRRKSWHFDQRKLFTTNLERRQLSIYCYFLLFTGVRGP